MCWFTKLKELLYIKMNENSHTKKEEKKMPKISLDQIDNYGSSGSGSFFQLKDDGDKANVRFLYKGIEDLTPYVVHEVPVGGTDNFGNPKTRYVNCLRNYDEPVDKCPLCAAQYKVVPKLFLKMFNEDVGECQIWERGKTYASRISNLASHFNPLVDEVVEISRCGKKGDKQTRYEFLPVENSPVNLEDYDCPDPLGTIILDKTVEELNQYLDLGSFPDSASTVSENRSSGNVQRRTPGNTSRRAF